nr:HepT-like ribonuclease domain-containing protein [Ornithinimicrobium sp. F0845]
MTAFAREAEHVVAQGRDRYLADDADGALLRNAGERVLIKVATVVEKLPDSFRQSHPNVPWVAIMRMRNLVAHHYDKVNADLMWTALTTRIPGLARELGLTED